MVNKNSEPDYSIFCKKYRFSPKRYFFFGFVSFIFRTFFNRKPKNNKSGNYLNLGCGLLRYEGFINADFFFRFSWMKAPYFPDWTLDLRYPLNSNDNFFDGVFTQHVLEHIYPDEARNLLAELFRTMKNEAWIRISVPDLGKYVDYYNGNLPDEKFRQWGTGAEAMRSLLQNYDHISVWDYELIEIFLREAGFSNIRRTDFMETSDKFLAVDSPEHRFESLYVEAQKIL
jgi:predicted SAM-dependent methyltransferase